MNPLHHFLRSFRPPSGRWVCFTSLLLLHVSFYGQQQARPRLLVVPPAENRPAFLAVHFQIAPGWYLYWLNPGDAGLPPEAHWDLPDGYSVGLMEFPVPQKIVHPPLVAYGYKGELLLRWPLQAPEASSSPLPDSVTVHLSWLVCKESCIPEEARLRWRRIEATETFFQQSAQLFQAWANRFPVPLSARALTLRMLPPENVAGGLLYRYQLQGDSARAVLEIYPRVSPSAIVQYQNLRIRNQVLEIPLAGKPAEQQILNGALAITRKGAYWVAEILPLP